MLDNREDEIFNSLNISVIVQNLYRLREQLDILLLTILPHRVDQSSINDIAPSHQNQISGPDSSIPEREHEIVSDIEQLSFQLQGFNRFDLLKGQCLLLCANCLHFLKLRIIERKVSSKVILVGFCENSFHQSYLLQARIRMMALLQFQPPLIVIQHLWSNFIEPCILSGRFFEMVQC